MTIFFIVCPEGSAHEPAQPGWRGWPAAGRSATLIEELVQAWGGEIVRSTEAGVLAMFRGGEPLPCTLDLQRYLGQSASSAAGGRRVRVALHADDQPFTAVPSSLVNRLGRVARVAWGGQILLTPDVLQEATLPAGATLQDLGLHLLQDLGEPQKIYSLLHPSLGEQAFRPLRSLSTLPHNLPRQPTPFLGREAELEAIGRCLGQADCQLLTLGGPGGIGKTRLAIQVAAEEIERFPHGVYFVSLAAITSADFILPAIADALGFSFYGPSDPKLQLLEYLKEKELLLVLDNFEQVMDGLVLLADILQQAPTVKLLITSRERLHIRHEMLFQLEGLRLPAEETTDTFESYEAVQLFLQSVRQVLPTFRLSLADRVHVLQICSLLGGSPLAIELAATWMRLLTPAEVVREVHGNLDFLETSLQDMPKRHRSMRAVFDYSWRLLSEAEQSVFERLSVFRGSFQRAAAARVANATLPLLTALRDKSLLNEIVPGQYQMHEVARQYAAEKLAGTPREQVAVRESHCQYYGYFLRMREPLLRGGCQQEAVAEIGAEIENVRAAWEWAREHRRLEIVGKAATALFLFYELRGWIQEGEEVFGRVAHALQRHAMPGGTREEVHHHALAQALAFQGGCRYRLGMTGQAKIVLKESLDLFSQGASCQELVFALYTAGDIARTLGDAAEAKHLLQEAVIVAQAIRDEYGLARSLNILGILAGAHGEDADAKLFFQEALARFQALENGWGVAKVSNNLGILLYYLQEYQGAKALCEASLAVHKTLGNKMEWANSLNNLGLILYQEGDYEEATRLQHQSLALFREIGFRQGMALTLNDLGKMALARRVWEEARGHFREALQIATSIQAVEVMLEVLVGVARLWQREECADKALELLLCVVQHPAASREAREAATALRDQLAATMLPPVVSEIYASVEQLTLEQVVARALATRLVVMGQGIARAVVPRTVLVLAS